MKTADLHLHTIASDGAFSPSELLGAARAAGLAAIAVTDHDSVESVAPALKLAPAFGMEVIAGIELSAEQDDSEVHILGYGFDFNDRALKAKLTSLRKARLKRTIVMLDKLAELGLDLPLMSVPSNSDRAMGRLHVAQAMLKAGHVATIPEAFRKYIGRTGPAYVPKAKLTPVEAIELIASLGGVAVLAHPFDIGKDELVEELAGQGLGGLEVYYPAHRPEQVQRYLQMARSYGLLVTGGSDCHGLNKDKVLIGSLQIPYRLVEKLKERFRFKSQKRQEPGE